MSKKQQRILVILGSGRDEKGGPYLTRQLLSSPNDEERSVGELLGQGWRVAAVHPSAGGEAVGWMVVLEKKDDS